MEALDTLSQTPLQLAVLNSHVGCLQKLMQAGASVLTRNSQNEAPLEVALHKNLTKIATFLISSALNRPKGTNLFGKQFILERLSIYMYIKAYLVDRK